MFGNDIEIRLDKYQFTLDDTINGVVILKLAKTVRAKGLFVSLVVREKSSQMNIGREGMKVTKSDSTNVVFRFDLPLDIEREYSNGGEYPFSIQIPQEAWPTGVQGMQNDGGIIGKGIGLLANFSPFGNKTRIYKVEAHLDIPWGMDIRESVNITLE
jgi:hypothetical protein